jgi:hypothetical protein
MASKRQNAPSEEADSCQVRSNALGAFERTHGHTQQQGSNARPISPSHHSSYLRSDRQRIAFLSNINKDYESLVTDEEDSSKDLSED